MWKIYQNKFMSHYAFNLENENLIMFNLSTASLFYMFTSLFVFIALMIGFLS